MPMRSCTRQYLFLWGRWATSCAVTVPLPAIAPCSMFRPRCRQAGGAFFTFGSSHRSGGGGVLEGYWVGERWGGGGCQIREHHPPCVPFSCMDGLFVTTLASHICRCRRPSTFCWR